MKKYLSSIFGGFLIALFVWACDNNDTDLGIDWIFQPEVQLAEKTLVKEKTGVNVKIHSKVYRQGTNEHFFQYSGNKNSLLISPKGDTILMNKETPIPYDGEFHLYKFVGQEGGQHDLKFQFRNNKNFKTELKKSINVEISEFVFTTTAQTTETTVGNAIDVAYTLEPDGNANQTFEVRFETSGDGQLNGQNEGVWFDVKKGAGTFSFNPTTSGSHQVTVYARSSLGVTKSSTFSVNVGIQAFDFAVSPSSTAGTINTKLPINFNISPKGNDTGQVYQMRYILESGKGEVEGINAGNWVVVDKGSFERNYLPLSAGLHKITFVVKNTAGTEVSKTIELSINQPDFNFTAVPVAVSTVINEFVDININLEAIGDDLGSTYELAYVSNGVGLLGGKAQNIYSQVQKGNFTLKYHAKSIGTHEITIKVKNKFGVEKEQNFSIIVSNYDFVFTAGANTLTPTINTATPINIDITPIGQDPNVTYSIKYELLTGEGKLENFNAGIFQPTQRGNTVMNFTPTTTGDVSLRLTAKNSAGSTHEQIIRFNVSVPDYNFTASSQANTTTVGVPIGVSYNLNPVGVNTQTFEVMLETTGDGQLGYNGNYYGEGVWIKVNSGSGSFDFKPTSAGQHEVVLKSRSNYNVEKEVRFTTNVKTPRFNFSATPSSLQFILNQQTPINLNITPIDVDSGLTYEVKYEITAGAGEIEGMTAGVYKSVNKGDFSVKFSSSQVGQTTIKFTAKNSAGTEVERTISLSTISAEFNVTASNLKNDVFVNTPVDINYSIDDLGVPQNFEVMMTTSGEGTLNGNQESVWFALNQNNGKLEFTPTNLGNHQITLHFRNQYGVQRTVNLSVNSISHEFTFTASATNNDIIINELKTLDFNLTQASSLQGIDYFIKYEILEGDAEVTGMQPNTYLGVNLGTFSKSITPRSAGALKIKFSVKNSFQLIKEQTLVFNVQVPDFNFTGTYQDLTTHWKGTDIDISYSINQFINTNQEIEYTVVSDKQGTFDGGTSLGTWRRIGSTSGKILYKPTEQGLHTITVKARNQYGVEKQFSFAITIQANPIIDPNSFIRFRTTHTSSGGWAAQTLTQHWADVKLVATNGNVKIKSVKFIIEEQSYFVVRAQYKPTEYVRELEYNYNDTDINIDKKLEIYKPNSKIKVIVTNEFGDKTEKYLN